MRPLLLSLLFAATLPCFAAAEWLSIPSKTFGKTRDVLVSVPDSYATGTQRYPVLYLTDGTTQALHTIATVKALSDTGRMPEMIVVGIRHEDRIHELTPTRVAQATVDGNLTRFPTSGGAPRLRTFLESEVMPLVESRYRTEAYRILAGHSYGALFALDTLFANPKLFNTIIAISPTVWWDDRYLVRRAQELVKAAPETRATIVLATGKESPAIEAGIAELKAALSSKSITLHSYYFEEEDHASAAVPGTYSALRRVFAPWFFRIDPSDDLTTLWTRAQAHAQELSKQYGYRVQVAEGRANQIGYMLLQAKRFPEAMQVFQANVAAYPGSPNAYDSLGDAFNATGDARRAWQNYERAVSLARNSKYPLLDAFEAKLADFKRKNPTLFPVPLRR